MQHQVTDDDSDALERLQRPPAPEPTEKDLARQRVGAFYRNQRSPERKEPDPAVGTDLRRRRLKAIRYFLMCGTVMVAIPLVGIGAFQRIDARRTIERAEAGDIGAAIRAAKLYSSGIGVNENQRASARWWLVAAMAGHPRAQEQVGQDYRYGGDGYPQDRDEAFRWYLASAHQGWGKSIVEVAELYAENPEDLDDLADSYMWMWLKVAADSFNLKDEVYSEGIIEGSGGYGSASYLLSAVYDDLSEEAKTDAKQRARAWRPVPSSPMDLTPGLEPRWWNPST